MSAKIRWTSGVRESERSSEASWTLGFVEWGGGGTYDTSQPSSCTGNQDDVAGHFVSLCVCGYIS